MINGVMMINDVHPLCPTYLRDDVSRPAVALPGQLVPVVVQLLRGHLSQAGHAQR